MNRLTSGGYRIDEDSDYFGSLRISTPSGLSASQIRETFQRDGYVLLRGALPATQVEHAGNLARTAFEHRLAEAPNTQELPGFYNPVDLDGASARALDALASHLALDELARIILACRSLRLDRVVMRAIPKGKATRPHCESLYVARGSPRLLTFWIPLAATQRSDGGLMLLENSHANTNRAFRRYLEKDHDDKALWRRLSFRHGRFFSGAASFSANPAATARSLNARWLTQDYKCGDVLVFGNNILHASLDNQTDGFRFSLDVRHQPAADVVDDRWMGEAPVGHAQHDPRIHGPWDVMSILFRWIRGKRTGLRPANGSTSDTITAPNQAPTLTKRC